MIPYIPPELTDAIIHCCATGLDSYPTAPGFSPSKANPTLLACSLVCRNWFPASRSLAFSSITLRCTPGDIRSLMDVVTSPACTFRGIVRNIRLVVPHGKPGVYVHENISQNMLVQLLKCLCLKSVTVEGADGAVVNQDQSSARKPVLIREQVFRVLKDTFFNLHKNQVIPPITSLTLSFLLFESFCDTTLLMGSFPELTSLALCNLSYVVPCVPSNLPLQKLGNLHIVGRQTPSLMVLWLMTAAEMMMTPIQEFKMSDVTEVVDVQRVGSYLGARRRVLKRFEIEFRVGWEENGNSVLKRALDQLGGRPEDLPRVIVHKN